MQLRYWLLEHCIKLNSVGVYMYIYIYERYSCPLSARFQRFYYHCDYSPHATSRRFSFVYNIAAWSQHAASIRILHFPVILQTREWGFWNITVKHSQAVVYFSLVLFLSPPLSLFFDSPCSPIFSCFRALSLSLALPFSFHFFIRFGWIRPKNCESTFLITVMNQYIPLWTQKYREDVKILIRKPTDYLSKKKLCQITISQSHIHNKSTLHIQKLITCDRNFRNFVYTRIA